LQIDEEVIHGINKKSVKGKRGKKKLKREREKGSKWGKLNFAYPT